MKNNMFQLIRQERVGRKTWYELSLIDSVWWDIGDIVLTEVKRYFGQHGPSKKTMKIWNRNEAEKQFLFVTLRWC